MPDPARSLTAPRLEAWANDLADREAALAADQARLEERVSEVQELVAEFDQHVADFEARSEAMVDRAADRSLTEAVHIVRRGFQTC